MKLTRNTKRASGMTLLELTVVILVLLSLISILFVGARAWKKGSDRAASILTIRNCQQAVRSYANMNGVNANTTVAELPTQIFGEGKFIENNPTVDGYGHPAGGAIVYQYGAGGSDLVPDVGDLYVTCSDAEYAPDPNTIGDW
ncbi:hypothetical protein [Luteolibacter marinus]|uniref:hypothetical protein n=1 Tax=Luteolibacter marinus TaxID=2776705 RepID=UPI001868C0A4|nr:hypothetical protein [Luteolibacter marinus]